MVVLISILNLSGSASLIRDFMVLLGTIHLTSATSVCKGPANGLKIEAVNNLTLGTIFFKLCKACQLKTMASIPPSAFSAGRIRQTQRDDREMKISKTSKGNGGTKSFNTSLMELSPLKYNSKLMNSIWGLYNRYSPHNVKKINDDNSFGAGEMQQTAASSANKPEPKIALASAKFDNVWTAMSHSH